MAVTLERAGRVAVVTIDNPPVNALNRAVRGRLLALAEELDADPGVQAVVLAGAGKLFVGGADITEFDRPVEPPGLPEVIARIERAAKPWIAALHGAALGGGLELALGCRLRIAAPGTRLALPETGLGLIPGAGGTQRLPRLIGAAAALEMVAEGKALTAEDAAGTGLVDRIAEEPRAAALALAEALPGLPPPAADRPAADLTEAEWQEAETRIRRAAKGAAAPLEALEVLRHGLRTGVAAGMERERAVFLTLRSSREAAALRRLFFAERAALRPADLKGVAPRPLSRVGVVGAGTMGAGIAAALRDAGLAVTLSDRDQPGLDRGLATLDAIFDAARRRGRLTEAEAAARREGVTGITGLDGLADCDLVIEAVFEDLEVKRAVFAELGRLCPQAILATNTSYIDPRRIAAGLPGPDRFLGLHFFSPAQVMKLVEIVPTPETSPGTLATGYDLARRLGKIPVRSGICDGFIGNRILRRYRAEAEALLREGTTPAAVDAAMRAWGYAMGPFEMQDMAGLDISFLHREAARARGEDVPETPGDLLVRAGRKGQKSGGGWYDYAPGSRAPLPSPEAARLIAPLTGPAREMPAADISARLVGAMAAEGRAILGEGIAASAADIDLVEVHGYGFPRWRGGPMFAAEETA